MFSAGLIFRVKMCSTVFSISCELFSYLFCITSILYSTNESIINNVWFGRYGVPYQPAAWCQNISVPVCDLTSVMMTADVTTRYHVKITAAGRCVGELLFYPYEQSKISSLTSDFLDVWYHYQSQMFLLRLLMGEIKRKSVEMKSSGLDEKCSC